MKGVKIQSLMKWTVAFVLSCGAGAALVLAGCSTSGWSDDGFNTGTGANVNFSGYYSKPGGGRIVSNSSGAPITTMTIFHSGNVVEGVDNNGSSYKGSIGSPNALIPPGAATATNSAQVAQAQVVLEGFDNSAGKNIQLVGIFAAVAVQDISSTSVTSGDTSSTTTSSGSTSARTESSANSSTNGQSITTIVITPNSTNTFNSGTNSSQSVSTSGGSTGSTTTAGSVTDGTTVTRTFGLTRANSQFELQGTWIEEGGVNGSVSATSPGGVGTVITTAAN